MGENCFASPKRGGWLKLESGRIKIYLWARPKKLTLCVAKLEVFFFFVQIRLKSAFSARRRVGPEPAAPLNSGGATIATADVLLEALAS